MSILYGVENLSVLDKATHVAFDTETTGLRPTPGGLRLLQLAAERCGVVVIDLWELDEEELSELKTWCAETPRMWYAHNAVFDLGWLQEHEIELNGVVHCTMLASRLLSNGIPNTKNGLASAVKRYLDIDVDKEMQKSDWSQPLLSEEQLTYAAKDVELLCRLYPVLRERLRIANLSAAFDLECGALLSIAHMQRVGIPFNRTKLEALRDAYAVKIEELGSAFIEQLDQAMPEEHKLPRFADGSFNLNARATGSVRLGNKVEAGFNINSPKQLVAKLTVLLGEEPIDSKTGKASGARSALRAYAADHQVIQTYLMWKRIEKRRQMVVALLEHQDADGFIRANYMQLGADTGRMSCREPNLQQVPRDPEFRAAAEAPEGWTFVCADFGQMELRLAAAISGDVTMRNAFKQGEDLHTLTAKAIYAEEFESADKAQVKQMRQVAKSANFGLLYGSGAKGLREYAGAMDIIMSHEEADSIRTTFLETYDGIAKWQKHNAAEAYDSAGNRWAETRIPGSGLRRYLPGELNRLTTRCNTPVQGAGAAVLKHALAALWNHIYQASEFEVKLCAVIHDEILCLVREGEEEKWKQVLTEVMESAEALWLGDVPPLAEAAAGKTWQEAK